MFGFTGGACVEPVVVREVRHILAEVNDSRRKVETRYDLVVDW
jgi:hypothetical protein